MVVLIDTNVIIDFLVAREPFYDSALHVIEKCASQEAVMRAIKMENFKDFEVSVVSAIEPDEWLKKLN